MEHGTIDDLPESELSALVLETILATMNDWRQRQDRTATVTVRHMGLSVTVKVKETSR